MKCTMGTEEMTCSSPPLLLALATIRRRIGLPPPAPPLRNCHCAAAVKLAACLPQHLCPLIQLS